MARTTRLTNKDYNKAVAKIDRWYTWDSRHINDSSVYWWVGTDHIGIIKPKRYWMAIVISKNDKQVWWYCESHSELNKVLHMIEFMCQ